MGVEPLYTPATIGAAPVYNNLEGVGNTRFEEGFRPHLSSPEQFRSALNEQRAREQGGLYEAVGGLGRDCL